MTAVMGANVVGCVDKIEKLGLFLHHNTCSFNTELSYHLIFFVTNRACSLYDLYEGKVNT